MVKRFFDIVFSIALLGVTSPVLAAIALAVYLNSGRPIFFSQVRVGRNLRHFKLWKFRTMKLDHDGPRLTVKGDARVTRVGRFLRATKLDELPQFFNVLAGDMTIVGPRPEVPEYVALYEERFRGILAERPGITDVASLRFRNEEETLSQSEDPIRKYCEELLPAKLDLAEGYLRTRNLKSDLGIIVQTALAMVSSGEQLKN
jgi:lipopolysaccharide/colanic/teichoic acid biosynthesis glycosyltransferase